MVKNLLANAGDAGDVGLIPWLGRSPGGGNGNTLQYSCLENLMNRGAWRATVREIAESDTTEHTCINVINRCNLKSQLRKGVCFPCEFLALPQLLLLSQRILTNLTLRRDGWPSEVVHVATPARLHALTKILKMTRTSTRCQSQAR